MFLKKKPALPKAPDVSRLKSFALFGEKHAGASGSEGAPGEIIDVDIVETGPASAQGHAEDAAQQTDVKGVRIKSRKPGTPLGAAADQGEGEPQREEPSPPDSATRKKWGGFGRKPVQAGASEDDGASAQKMTQPAGSKKSFFSFGRGGATGEPARETGATPEPDEMDLLKKAKGAASKKSKWGRKASKGKASTGEAKKPRVDAPKGCVDLLVEMENGRRVYWRVSKTDVTEVDGETVKKAISFSRPELRLTTQKALHYGAAQDQVLSELGEDAFLVNASKSLGAVYALTVRRAQELGGVITAPGLMLMDAVLKERQDPDEGQPLLCTLVLKSVDGAARVAVLCHFTENGELGALQVTVNPDNLSFVLSQFAAARRLNTEQTQVVLLENADFLQAVGKVSYYPNEALWHGYSVRKAFWGVTWGTAAVAAVCALYGAKGFASKEMATRAAAAARAEDAAAKKKLDNLLVGGVVKFARLQSLPLPDITERAGTVWTPGATVMVEAGLKSQVYTIKLPLTRGGMVGSRPSVLAQTLPSHVKPLLDRDPPEGCVKSLPEISGALNVVQLTITCESPTGALTAYRLD